MSYATLIRKADLVKAARDFHNIAKARKALYLLNRDYAQSAIPRDVGRYGQHYMSLDHEAMFATYEMGGTL